MRSAIPKTRYRLLAVAFCALLGLVPLIQIVIEWKRGGSIQSTDVFRYPFQADQLRRFERALERESWLWRMSRSIMRELRIALLNEPGGQVVRGVDDWLFYRPGVRYLVERSAAGSGRRKDLAMQSIRQFKEALGERGIELIVVPVPDKASIYPDRLARHVPWEKVWSPTEGFIEELRAEGLEVIDLFASFRELRRSGVELYLAQDTHWTPAGAEGAAEQVAARLLSLGWIAQGAVGFEMGEVRVWRRGDLVELGESAGLRRRYPGEEVRARQVWEPGIGLLVPSLSERPGVFRDLLDRSQVLVLGDSYSRIYQFTEPSGVGKRLETVDEEFRSGLATEITARLHPGSAGFVSHLARALDMPVDAVVSDGGASTEVRQRLSVNPEILEGKRVVVWQFAEHELELGEWRAVPLPRSLELGATITPTGRVDRGQRSMDRGLR